MLVHHSVTVFLLVSSFSLNYVRMGLLVLLYHDVSDVLPCLTKTTNYLGYKKITLFFYANMCVVWFLARLYYYPRVIFITALALDPWRTSQLICVACLSVLVVLHAYWFHLFLKMGAIVLKSKGHTATDLTEHRADRAHSLGDVSSPPSIPN
jgi:hypothetical protein